MDIRRARIGDAGEMAAIYRPHVETGAASFEQIAPDGDEMARRIAAAGEAYPWLVAEAERGVLGYAYAGAHRSRHAYRWSVDTAIYVADGGQRKGVGKRLYGVLLDVLARQHFVMAFAGIAMPNPASIGLHASVGFERVARYPNVGFKQGEWRDTEWWARPLAERTVPPRDLLAVPSRI
ncbi:MAG: N-acetyltransferase family protein [Pseudomonadota bacterium]